MPNRRWILLMLLASLGAIRAAFAAPTSYDCNYTTFSDNRGLHKVAKEFRMMFLVDSSADKAYMIGSIGASDVLLVPNTEAFTLIEMADLGNVYVTVITSKGHSVHSRSSIISGVIVPSQYYGTCHTK